MVLHKHLFVSAVFAVTLVLAASTARAELAPPRLHARSRPNGTVRVSWSSTRGLVRDAVTVVEIERGPTIAEIVPLVTVPSRPRKYDDVAPPPGLEWYRVRVVSDGIASPWSAAVDVEVEAPPQPIPTATPSSEPGADDPPLGAGQRECRAGTIEETLALVNQARAAVNAPPLREHPDLRWAARVRALTLATKQRLSHDGWVDTLTDSGYRANVAAENIAVGYWSPAAVVQGWMSSAGHRQNIESRAYRDTGIGCVIDQNGALWWAEDFGG